MTIRKLNLSALLALCTLLSPSAVASVKVSGHFVATEACPVYQSIKKKTNPGNHKTEPGTRYPALFLNKPNGDWVQIRVPQAQPDTRWVNTECGQSAFTQAAGKQQAGATNKPTKAQQCQTKGLQDSYVLAVSWQPGFCEHSKGSAKKPECAALLKGKRTTHNLTLHGLWPNKRACGTKYGYCEPNNKMQLSASTIKTIAPWMPNFYYENDFGAYQWKKHGTCQTRDDDTYFLLAADLVKQVDNSAIGQYIKANIGQTVNVKQFQRHLNSTLGTQATQRIQLSCINKRYLQEVRITLGNDFERYTSLTDKLDAAPKARNFQGNCSATIHIED
ncbi:ribonuclease I precursor [Photobacterium aphoticum]|uniref:Ribonuclease I n=1 Tax=Photobacterium aphoticum TaxID=754436 RepID=A0A090QKV9_9GAMM|nr:ribonuclease I precursor [Photobacterium aphoticum]